MVDQCNSCKQVITNDSGSVKFKCPNCTGAEKGEIIRCSNCRKNATKYVCPTCSFEGPN